MALEDAEDVVEDEELLVGSRVELVVVELDSALSLTLGFSIVGTLQTCIAGTKGLGSLAATLLHLRPRRGLLVSVVEGVSFVPALLALLRSAVGALDGLRRLPVVSLVCAARISGAMRAMSGKEVGAVVDESA